MLSDLELLTQLIERVQPGADAEAIAHRLLQIHGGLGTLLDTEAGDLAALCGLRPSSTQTLCLIPQLARYMAREQANKLTRINTFRRASRYLDGIYLGAKRECFYLLCLDKAGKLLECSLVQQGTIDEVPFSLRRMLENAMRIQTHAVILSHNHPSGTRFYSPYDVNCTHDAIRLFLPLDIIVLDHILSANGKCYSMHNCRDFPKTLFTRQSPGDPLIANWMSTAEDDA